MLLKKEIYLLYYELGLFYNDFYFNDFTFYFSFGIFTVKYNRKIGATAATWSYIFIRKNCKCTYFLNRQPQIKFLVAQNANPMHGSLIAIWNIQQNLKFYYIPWYLFYRLFLQRSCQEFLLLSDHQKLWVSFQSE